MYRSSSIRLTTNSVLSIDSVVLDKREDTVMSLDSNGRLIKNKIIGWIKKPLESTENWIKIGFISRKKSLKGQVGAVLSENEEVLSKRGWIKTKEITNEDLIASGEAVLNNEQFQVMIGTLLGDGSLGKKSLCLELGHCIKQYDWLKMKAKVFGIEKLRIFTSNHKDGTVRKGCYCRIPSNKELLHLRDKFYIPTRQAPKDCVNNLSELGLATWFLDNGNSSFSKFGGFSSCEIAAHALNSESLEIMSNILIKNFSINHYIRNNRFIFNKENAFKIYDLIAKFTPDCMQYKLSKYFRNKFDESLFDYKKDQFTAWYKTERLPLSNRVKATKQNFSIILENSDNFVTNSGVVKTQYKT